MFRNLLTYAPVFLEIAACLLVLVALILLRWGEAAYVELGL